MNTRFPPRRWSNVFSGLLWFAAGFMVITAAQVVVATAIAITTTTNSGGYLDEHAKHQILSDGDIVAFAFPLALPIVLALLSVAIRNRRRDISEYLALNSVSAAVLARWAVLTLVLMLLSYGIGLVTGQPEIPEWVATAYPSVDHRVVFALSVVVLGPVLEEGLYRGYILRTWIESPLNQTTSMVLLSLLWTVTHVQYQFYDMAWVFVLGMALVYARLATRSLYPPLLMHMLWNFAAIVQLEWHFSHATTGA